jgi:hypothetical protein
LQYLRAQLIMEELKAVMGMDVSIKNHGHSFHHRRTKNDEGLDSTSCKRAATKKLPNVGVLNLMGRMMAGCFVQLR